MGKFKYTTFKLIENNVLFYSKRHPFSELPQDVLPIPNMSLPNTNILIT